MFVSMDLAENIIIAQLLEYQLKKKLETARAFCSYLHIFSPYLHNLNFENLNFLS